MGAPLPQPWTGHRSVVPMDASMVEAIRRGAVVEFSMAPAADAPRMRARLTASPVGPAFYWNQFDAQGRSTGTREVLADEVDDLVHGLVAPELVPVSMLDSVEGEIERLIAAIDSASGLDRISMASEALMLTDGSSRVHVARHYFRAVLQDSTVQTAIGPVQIVGGTWREMRRGMASDGIKAALVPMVPKILSDGRVEGGRQPDTKGRNDYVAFYFIRLNGINVGDKTVDAGVGVGERPEGLLEYRLNAYSLGHSEMPAWQKRIAGGLPFGYEPKAPPAMGGGEPLLDDIMEYQQEDCNIVILAVRDAIGAPAVMDSASIMDRARIAADVARKLAELQASTGMQRARIAAELAGLVGSDSVSIYNSDTGDAAAKEPTMETTTPAMDRNETEARALLAAGFKTKADQKRAKDAASRAFERVMEAVRGVHLADRDNPAGEAVYFAMPMYPHEWKPKHADMIRSGLPGAAVHIEAADRIASLAADIKAAPLLPTVAEEKAARERAALAVQAMNPALKEAFEAQAPALAREFVEYIRKIEAGAREAFPDGIPHYVSATGPKAIFRDSIAILRTLSDTVTKRGQDGKEMHTLVLNEGKLAREAEDYGARTALQWFHKTNQKLGDLQNPVLISDRDGQVHVKGERGGQAVELVQQRIINVSPLGKLFHQFPSRIYVGGKFMTEEAYAKAYPPAA